MSRASHHSLTRPSLGIVRRELAGPPCRYDADRSRPSSLRAESGVDRLGSRVHVSPLIVTPWMCRRRTNANARPPTRQSPSLPSSRNISCAFCHDVPVAFRASIITMFGAFVAPVTNRRCVFIGAMPVGRTACATVVLATSRVGIHVDDIDRVAVFDVTTLCRSEASACPVVLPPCR